MDSETAASPAASHLSPSLSLAQREAGPAFELKFLLDEQRAEQVEAWARHYLALDPHGDPSLQGAYRTTSVYCDTPQLDVYYRAPWYRSQKFRVRRYGLTPHVFLERKSKRGDRVKKRRSSVPAEQLTALTEPLCLPTWPGYWFHRRLDARRLGPVCQIVYERMAYVGTAPDGPLRLTLDRRIRGVLTDQWALATNDNGLSLLAGQVIVELKFRAALPACFKELVAAIQLVPAKVSKYRLCREAFGARGDAMGASDA
jgi:hypothetical protein